ncbi:MULTISPECIES: hypothetical protein [unclassified Bacillus (in: firmicutes)]|uniref:hypothetical protein n=1 Tax=unclassified Bacillus (in: firmicutes) TaxID=185979 RepID=UPI00227EF6E8|nr:hypothetical protein [Bacillus sp. S20C3]MCY8202245.1 hypothetical protein [Bacillus sp. N12A5]MCY8290608.1 hypothetical protein [Bacillus sp. N13C7]MCY8640085.1 hypothetical protein [Bacillus sp. S17B2]MCY8720527.1 hypothetical protein [Bacillus sp. S10C12M]MCY9144319.1 hypothetical protein [Bacillus sp. T9C1]
MESTLIVGADEFFGLSLCERMMEEGIHVDVILAETEDEMRQMYLEERLMWLGRNELFRQLEHIGERKYDTICIQFGGLPLDRYDSPYVLVYEQDRTEWEKIKKTGSEKAVILPKMYGPWKEDTGEDGFYTDDVADELLRFLLEPSRDKNNNQIFNLQVTQKTSKEEAKTKIIEWKRQFSSIFDKY